MTREHPKTDTISANPVDPSLCTWFLMEEGSEWSWRVKFCLPVSLSHCQYYKSRKRLTFFISGTVLIGSTPVLLVRRLPTTKQLIILLGRPLSLGPPVRKQAIGYYRYSRCYCPCLFLLKCWQKRFDQSGMSSVTASLLGDEHVIHCVHLLPVNFFNCSPYTIYLYLSFSLSLCLCLPAALSLRLFF